MEHLFLNTSKTFINTWEAHVKQLFYHRCQVYNVVVFISYMVCLQEAKEIRRSRTGSSGSSVSLDKSICMDISDEPASLTLENLKASGLLQDEMSFSSNDSRKVCHSMSIHQLLAFWLTNISTLISSSCFLLARRT